MSEATADDTKLKMNRQEFLNLAWLASLGVLTLEVTGVTILFSYPKLKEGEFGGIFTFGTVEELPEVGSAPANYPKVKLWMSHTDEGVMAIYKICPHLGCLYGWSDQEFKFICPCHGSQYEHDGTWIQGPAPRSLDRMKISIVDEDGNEIMNNEDIIYEDVPYGPIPASDIPEGAKIVIDTADRVWGADHD